MTTLAFCQALPKVELHAHLNGSISDETLEVLNARLAQPIALDLARNDGKRDLNECFELFAAIHKLCCDTVPTDKQRNKL